MDPSRRGGIECFGMTANGATRTRFGPKPSKKSKNRPKTGVGPELLSALGWDYGIFLLGILGKGEPGLIDGTASLKERLEFGLNVFVMSVV